MAGDWIKVEMSTIDKPEVLRIARITGLDADAVMGKLIRLWCWFDRNSRDGVVDGVVDGDVDGVCRHDGFAAALVSVNWLILDRENETCEMPNFDRHNGKSAKSRTLRTERQARYRDKTSKNVDVVVDAPPSTKASPEKRREEKSIDIPPTPNGGIDLPEQLQTDQFREAWAEWKKYRTEIRKPLKPTTEKSQLKKFAEWGPAKAAAAIRRSIENGWQGIFEPDAKCLVPDDSTPYPEIADIFNKHCGERLAPIQHASDTRKALMTELYRRLGKDLKRVEEYFARVAASNKLMGLYGAQKSTADWLLRWDNAARVLDGQFDNM